MSAGRPPHGPSEDSTKSSAAVEDFRTSRAHLAEGDPSIKEEDQANQGWETAGQVPLRLRAAVGMG